MLVGLALCVLSSLHIDVPVVVSAQAPASNLETFMTPWLGMRLAAFDNDDEGLFKAVDAQLLLGFDSQGTNEVKVLRIPLLVEGRALLGWRWRGGLVGVAGYGFGGVGGGGGVSWFQAFDDGRVRPFGLWSLRGGGGVEFSFGPAYTRVEIGIGLRDLRPETSGSFAVGTVF